MSQIVIKDLDTKASLNSVEMSATRGGAPRREDSGKYMSSVPKDMKQVFVTDGGERGVLFWPGYEVPDVGTMAANTANMGIIFGSN